MIKVSIFNDEMRGLSWIIWLDPIWLHEILNSNNFSQLQLMKEMWPWKLGQNDDMWLALKMEEGSHKSGKVDGV